MSANAAVPTAAAVPRKPRREIAWSAEPQKCLMPTASSLSIVEPKLRPADQCPDHLSVCFGQPVGPAADVLLERAQLLRARRAAQYGPDGQVDRLVQVVGRLDAAEQPVVPVRQEFAGDLVAVAEEEGFADADLEVVRRLRE